MAETLQKLLQNNEYYDSARESLMLAATSATMTGEGDDEAIKENEESDSNISTDGWDSLIWLIKCLLDIGLAQDGLAINNHHHQHQHHSTLLDTNTSSWGLWGRISDVSQRDEKHRMYQVSLQSNGSRVQRHEDYILSLQEVWTEMNKRFARLPMDRPPINFVNGTDSPHFIIPKKVNNGYHPTSFIDVFGTATPKSPSFHNMKTHPNVLED